MYGDVVIEHVDFNGSVHTYTASSYVDGHNMPQKSSRRRARFVRHVALRCRRRYATQRNDVVTITVMMMMMCNDLMCI